MARNTIQIKNDVSDEGQLQELVVNLESAGFCCRTFQGTDGINAALLDPGTILLLLGITEDELPVIARSGQAKTTYNVPIVAYFPYSPNIKDDELLIPEIDDFLIGPVNNDATIVRIRGLIRQFLKAQEITDQVRENLISHFGLRQFIGNAPSFLDAVNKLQRLARCDATVLLHGDTGTGKEMYARAIHYLGERASKPFIPVNCGSIPADLFENEMFGHEPGAYTDARQSRRGLVAEAEGGTLFLDEVDSLAFSAQVKLLRFLQDREYRPLGGAHYRRSNTRVLAASNQKLQQKVDEGSFREDLFYRLKVVSISLPPLRERQEDIMPLAFHFLKISAAEYGCLITLFTHEAMQKLLSYSWPGNVRELENVVRNAVVLAAGSMIHGRDIHLPTDLHVVSTNESLKVAKARTIEAFERAYLRDILFACDGNISEAARRAQKDRRAFFALLKKYNLTASRQEYFGAGS